MKRVIGILGFVFGMVVLAAVPSVSEEGGPSYAADVEPVVLTKCVGCHTVEKPKNPLALDQGTGYEKLVGQPSRLEPDKVLVVPGDPGASYLWQKLMHTTKEGKGMPRTMFGSKKLPEEELEVFRRWIETGARP